MENQFITEEIQEQSDYGNEQLKAKFTGYAYKTFGFTPGNSSKPSSVLKKYTKLCAFKLPDSLNEPFIKQEFFYLFWIADSNFLTLLEKGLKFKAQNDYTENYLAIKKIYYKWAFAKNSEDKKYCAKSFLNKTSAGIFKENPIILLQKGTILAFDPVLYSSTNAIETFEQALNSAKKHLASDEKLLILFEYIVSLFKGFIYLNTTDTYSAKKYFEDAAAIYPAGANAKFYLALTECSFNNCESSFELLCEIINVDIEKLKISIELKNVFLFNYLIENLFFYNIFEYAEFIPLLESIEKYFESISEKNQKDKTFISEKLNAFQKLELEEEFLTDSKIIISFIEKYLELKIPGVNPFARVTDFFVTQSFDQMIKKIIHSISSKFREYYQSSIEVYNDDIERKRLALRDLEAMLVVNQQKRNKGFNEAIERLEKNYNQVIAHTEEKLENIHTDKKFNPRTSFNNAMVYNIMITLFIFIIGGFSGCYSSSYNVLSDIKSLSSVVLLSGFKWANLTFLAGFIISLISAAMILVERSGERQRLLQKISGLKNRKEKEKKLLKSELERSLKSLEKTYKEKINALHESINSIIAEKEAKERAVEEEIKKETEIQTAELRVLLSS